MAARKGTELPWNDIQQANRKPRPSAGSWLQQLAPGAVVAFTGDLGAGKTAFVRGMAQGLGISQRVTSPTFTIVNEV
ncbi:MAG: tRNA (adenosine(37)-N6)-threonylcarbamoyltransferase complex ATPase subunit type 1 TsaE [Evtepia gabavorous]